MLVWTEAYRSWIHGGNCNAPVCTEVPEAHGPFDLGKGMEGYLIAGPNGKTFVVESRTGGIVGPNLASVRDDVAGADPLVLAKQIEAAQERVKEADTVALAEFWKLLRAG